MGVKSAFDRLDQSYLNDLVVRAGQGSSNAFAELFASVSDRQLYYLCALFGDREQAVNALGNVFMSAWRELPALTRPELFTLWLSRFSANEYFEKSGQERAKNGRYTLSQFLNLPLAESQIMLMKYENGLSDAEIGEILNVGRSTVRRFVRLGRRHLNRDTSGANQESGDHSGTHSDLKDFSPLTPVEAAHVLDNVFESCNADANTVPMEALSSYAIYRKERFSLQRSILGIAIAVFMMLPVLFLVPSYSVSVEETGERGLPVYTIEVKSLLPVGKVLASFRNHRLPVYEAGSKEYTVEPTRNGKLSITVELINRQRRSGEYDVVDVDSNGPQLIDNRTVDDTFVIMVKDAGIGVDYREVYAQDNSGNVHYPITANADEGIVFEYPEEAWDIYIPDHIGNTLHLVISLK